MEVDGGMRSWSNYLSKCISILRHNKEANVRNERR